MVMNRDQMMSHRASVRSEAFFELFCARATKEEMVEALVHTNLWVPALRGLLMKQDEEHLRSKLISILCEFYEDRWRSETKLLAFIATFDSLNLSTQANRIRAATASVGAEEPEGEPCEVEMVDALEAEEINLN